MSTALTTIEPNPGVEVYEAPDSLGALVELKPTNIDLVQLTSRQPGAIPGKMRDAVTLEHFDSITVVPLDIRKGRVMFPPSKDDFTQKPICRSSDGLVPSPYVETPQSSSCATCRYSKWSKAGGKSIKPDCTETLTLLCIVKESELPRYINFKGAGMKPFTDFLTRIETDRVREKARSGRKPNIFEYFFSISGQEIIGKSGKYYVPFFSNVNRVADPSAFELFYQKYVLAAQQEEEEVAAEEKIDVSVESVINSGIVHNAEYVDA